MRCSHLSASLNIVKFVVIAFILSLSAVFLAAVLTHCGELLPVASHPVTNAHSAHQGVYSRQGERLPCSPFSPFLFLLRYRLKHFHNYWMDCRETGLFSGVGTIRPWLHFSLQRPFWDKMCCTETQLFITCKTIFAVKNVCNLQNLHNSSSSPQLPCFNSISNSR